MKKNRIRSRVKKESRKISFLFIYMNNVLAFLKALFAAYCTKSSTPTLHFGLNSTLMLGLVDIFSQNDFLRNLNGLDFLATQFVSAHFPSIAPVGTQLMNGLRDHFSSFKSSWRCATVYCQRLRFELCLLWHSRIQLQARFAEKPPLCCFSIA
jgi:hypothetical protein